jgi:hypothetical protein
MEAKQDSQAQLAPLRFVFHDRVILINLFDTLETRLTEEKSRELKPL